MRSDIIQELRHEIHSPLTALRNALHLISVTTDDSMVQEYVKLAEAEAVVIAEALNLDSALQRSEKAA